jgi:hypothetical protein
MKIRQSFNTVSCPEYLHTLLSLQAIPNSSDVYPLHISHYFSIDIRLLPAQICSIILPSRCFFPASQLTRFPRENVMFCKVNEVVGKIFIELHNIKKGTLTSMHFYGTTRINRVAHLYYSLFFKRDSWCPFFSAWAPETKGPLLLPSSSISLTQTFASTNKLAGAQLFSFKSLQKHRLLKHSRT